MIQKLFFLGRQLALASGARLNSIWLMYAKELKIKIIQNANFNILELLPPDSPLDGSSECSVQELSIVNAGIPCNCLLLCDNFTPLKKRLFSIIII